MPTTTHIYLSNPSELANKLEQVEHSTLINLDSDYYSKALANNHHRHPQQTAPYQTPNEPHHSRPRASPHGAWAFHWPHACAVD